MRVFNSRSTLFPNRVLLYSVQLCWQNAERWLVSCHRCFCFASVRCTYLSFCLIYFKLFKLFNLEIEWSNAKMLQLIELYKKRPYLCDKVAACNWTITAHATFIVRRCCTLARENCSCDIGLTPQPQSITTLWLVLIAPTHGGMASVSLPAWLAIYTSWSDHSGIIMFGAFTTTAKEMFSQVSVCLFVCD